MSAKLNSLPVSTGRCTSALAWGWRAATPWPRFTRKPRGELDYALEYAASHGDLIEVEA
mgnify:CR=1 FL=1